MQREEVRPNEVTIVCVLSACSHLGALELGRWVHSYLDDCDNENDIEIQPSTFTSSMQTTTSGSRRKRRRMVESMEQNMLMGMVEAAKEIAKALKPQKCDHIERALRQLPDITDDQVFDGMDLLGPDSQLTEVLFGLSEDSSRKAWLMRMLKRQN